MKVGDDKQTLVFQERSDENLVGYLANENNRRENSIDCILETKGEVVGTVFFCTRKSSAFEKHHIAYLLARSRTWDRNLCLCSIFCRSHKSRLPFAIFGFSEHADRS